MILSIMKSCKEEPQEGNCLAVKLVLEMSYYQYMKILHEND